MVSAETCDGNRDPTPVLVGSTLTDPLIQWLYCPFGHQEVLNGATDVDVCEDGRVTKRSQEKGSKSGNLLFLTHR